MLAGWWKGCPSYWGGSCSLLAQEGTKALIPGLQKNGKQRSQEPRHSPLAFLNIGTTGFQSEMLWGFIFWYRFPGLGTSTWGLDHLLHRCTPHLWYLFCYWVITLLVCVLTRLFLPPLHFLMWPLKNKVPSCSKSVLLIFGMFSEMVALYVVVVLVCPWKEVNLGFFYSTI